MEMLITLLVILLMAAIMVQSVLLSRISRAIDMLEVRQEETSEIVRRAANSIKMQSDEMKELEYMPIRRGKSDYHIKT